MLLVEHSIVDLQWEVCGHACVPQESISLEPTKELDSSKLLAQLDVGGFVVAPYRNKAVFCGNVSADYILPLNILYRENRNGVPLKRGLGLIVHTYAMRR